MQHWIHEITSEIKNSKEPDDLNPDRLLKSPLQKKQQDDFTQLMIDTAQKKSELDKKFIDNWGWFK